MRPSVPDYLDKTVMSTRNAFRETLRDPRLWSDKITKDTLNRMGGSPFSIQDVQALVEDHL